MDGNSARKIKENPTEIDFEIPEQKDEYITNIITLLRKYAEVAATENTLVKERKDFKKNMLLLKKRHKEFIRKELLFEDFTKRYDKFLQENSVKFAQAAKKKEEEENSQIELTNKITSLKEEIQLLQQKENRLNQQIQNYQIFQEFVRKVVNSSGGEFNTVNDVVNQFEMLMFVLKELSEQERLFNEEIEIERTEMVQYIEEKNNEILEYNNQIVELQRTVDCALNEALKWESRWNHLKNTIRMKCLERGQIKMVVRNLFNKVIKHQKLDFHTEDTMKQLEKIQEFIVDWKEVVEEMKDIHLTSENPLYSKTD